MAAISVGGTILIPGAESDSEKEFFRSISKHHRRIDEPLSRNSLLTLFNTHKQGHDGAAIVDFVGCAAPWIRSSGIHLPYDTDKLPRRMPNRHLRHHSALYASTLTLALIIVVSEEHGTISVFQDGCDHLDVSERDLKRLVRDHLRSAAGDEEAVIGEITEEAHASGSSAI